MVRYQSTDGKKIAPTWSMNIKRNANSFKVLRENLCVVIWQFLSFVLLGFNALHIGCVSYYMQKRCRFSRHNENCRFVHFFSKIELHDFYRIQNDSDCVIFQKEWMFLIQSLPEAQKNSSQWHGSQAAACLLFAQFFFHIIPSSEDLPNHKVFKVGTLLLADQEELFLVVAGLNLLSN